jgi:hypothetical protein
MSARKADLNFVANSSDIDGEGDLLTASEPANKKRKFLHSVTIPAMSSGKSTPASRVTKPTGSSRSSFGSTTRDNSIGYDTPATSAVATPAEGSVIGRRSFKLGGVSLNASNKRKRGSALAESSRAAQSLDMSMDAQLARRLQAEEYGDVEEAEAPTFGKFSSRNTTRVVHDSDEELSELSELSVRLPFIIAIVFLN